MERAKNPMGNNSPKKESMSERVHHVQIDEKTKIPMIWLFACVLALTGPLMWLSRVSDNSARANDRISKLEQDKANDDKEVTIRLQRIELSLARIQERMGIKTDKEAQH